MVAAAASMSRSQVGVALGWYSAFGVERNSSRGTSAFTTFGTVTVLPEALVNEVGGRCGAPP